MSRHALFDQLVHHGTKKKVIFLNKRQNAAAQIEISNICFLFH